MLATIGSMQVGRFEVIRQLGSGGMSEALLAKSPAGRLVVLKRPRKPDADLNARLRDEGRLGAKLFHANLVETIEVFEHEGLPVVALGFVEGPTVDELRKQRAVPAAAIARIGCQIAEALGCIHDALGDDGQPLRAVHRDVSPRNIVVATTGDAVLIDLGIARFDELRSAQTETGMVLGTLRYMAPELIDGAAASPASDFYSLGCVLIEAATGEPCFAGQPSEVAAAIVAKGPLAGAASAGIEPRLRELLARMCARDPRQRFQQAHEVSRTLRELEAALGGGQRLLAAGAATYMQAAAVQNPFSAAVEAPKAVTGIASQLPGSASSATGYANAPAPAPAPSFSSPVQPPPAPRPFAPPPAGAPLELALEPRVTRAHVPLQDYVSAEHHRPKYREESKVLATALKVLAVVALLAVGYGYWRYGDDAEARTKAEQVRRRLEGEAKLLQDAMRDSAEPCESRSDVFWVYTNEVGTDVVVDSAQKVPRKYRSKARCVAPAK